jgi:hypothetical protein
MKKYWQILNSRIRRYLHLGVFILVLISCNPVGNTGSGDVLVRVYDKYLYASDLEGVITPGLSVRDSLTMVRTYIQNWVDDELLIRKAEENLPEEVKDFSRELEDYRNSLIIFEYKKMLLQQQLDTNIGLDAIASYYRDHGNRFALKKDVVMMKYLMLHTDSPAKGKLTAFLQSDEMGDKDSLALYCSKYASDFSLADDRWLEREELKEYIPDLDYGYDAFLANRRYFELNDSNFVYLIRFMDYRPADSIAPVPLIEKQIREMILNKRKNSLIKEMQQTVLQDAIANNQVEIF